LSKVIRWSAVGLALVVGIVSFIDAFRFGKSRKTQDIALQLPKAVKLRIHKVISGNLSGTQLATGAIVTGFLVTLLEAVCTGQVYLPTIILMTKQHGLRFTGWLYLIFYNVLFVMPLLIVMALAYFGLKWDRLAKVTQQHLPLLKVLLGVVLIALAAFLAFAG
jgi:cytochrome c biogenesis protein CcdA